MVPTSADANDAPVSAPPPNFIIFGEMGAGKSSLINLISGKDLAKTSSGAISCTLQSTEYKVWLPDSQCEVNLYDTASKIIVSHSGLLTKTMQAGLNEPTMNNANFADAIGNAHDLIVSLQTKGGIHGLLFCIRGGRISETVQRNYKLFYEFLCQEKVPLALVITGLENEPDEMDAWWTQNKTHVQKSGISPVAHVCITTIKGFNNVYETRYVESREKVRKMLGELSCHVAYSVDRHSWFARMYKKMRGFWAPGKRLVAKGRVNMMEILIKRCGLGKEEAKQIVRRIEEKEKD